MLSHSPKAFVGAVILWEYIESYIGGLEVSLTSQVVVMWFLGWCVHPLVTTFNVFVSWSRVFYWLLKPGSAGLQLPVFCLPLAVHSCSKTFGPKN